jgi:hypothetical protein
MPVDKRDIFVSRTILNEEYGGKRQQQQQQQYQRLPLYSCALSLQSIQGEPVCTPDGTVFDIMYVHSLYVIDSLLTHTYSQ